MRRMYVALLTAIVTSLLLSPAAFARDELKNKDPEKYYVLLDLNNQIVTAFEKDDAGEYTKVVRRMLCSSGRTQVDPEDPEDQATPTPRGVYKIGGRERFGKFASFEATYARYWTQIVGGVYFHSIIYSKRDIGTLQKAAYKNLGRNVSHGCVRLYVEDAKWLYYYAPPGTTIRVSTTEPGRRSLAAALKSKMSFKAYKAFQKRIYDDDERPNLTAWVTVGGAKVRSGNGTNDRALFTLKEGEEVEVLLAGDPWLKVKYNKREGYIKNAYVTFEKGVMMSRPDADILKGTVYMLAEPKAKAKPIVKIPYDTSVKVLEAVDDVWLKIIYENETGYIKKGWLKKGWGLIRD